MRALLAATLAALGVALLVQALARGGGTTDGLFGLLFLVAGAGRLYLLRGR